MINFDSYYNPPDDPPEYDDLHCDQCGGFLSPYKYKVIHEPFRRRVEELFSFDGSIRVDSEFGYIYVGEVDDFLTCHVRVCGKCGAENKDCEY